MALSVAHSFVSAIADVSSAAQAGQVVPSNWNAPHTLAGLVDLTQLDQTISPSWTGSHTFNAQLTQQAGSVMSSTFTGTYTGSLNGNNGINQWYIRDQANVTTGVLAGLYLRNQYGGGNATGSRFNLFSYWSLDQTPSSLDTSIKNYTGATFQTYAQAVAVTSATSGSSYAGYSGSLWGADVNTFLAGNAKNWNYFAGFEIGISIFNDGVTNFANVADRWGLPIYSGGDIQGDLDDAGILVSQGGVLTNAKWKTAIQFGAIRHNFPTSSQGTIIGAKARTAGFSETPKALYGIDFLPVNFTTGGAAFRSQGFSVDPTGAIICTLPTSNPHILGALWNNANVVNISTG